jgi:hypothetical protein
VDVRSGLYLRLSHDPSLAFMASNPADVARSGIHTAEVTGSIPVAPTSEDSFPGRVRGAGCQHAVSKRVAGRVELRRVGGDVKPPPP